MALPVLDQKGFRPCLALLAGSIIEQYRRSKNAGRYVVDKIGTRKNLISEGEMYRCKSMPSTYL